MYGKQASKPALAPSILPYETRATYTIKVTVHEDTDALTLPSKSAEKVKNYTVDVEANEKGSGISSMMGGEKDLGLGTWHHTSRDPWHPKAFPSFDFEISRRLHPSLNKAASSLSYMLSMI